MTLARFSPPPASALCTAAAGVFFRAAGPARRLTAALAASNRVVVRYLLPARSVRSSVCVCPLPGLLALIDRPVIGFLVWLQLGCGLLTLDYLATVDAYPRPDDKIRTGGLQVRRSSAFIEESSLLRR
jgi:hypothetical protein